MVKPNKVLGQKVKSTPESETTDTSNDDKKQIAYGWQANMELLSFSYTQNANELSSMLEKNRWQNESFNIFPNILDLQNKTKQNKPIYHNNPLLSTWNSLVKRIPTRNGYKYAYRFHIWAIVQSQQLHIEPWQNEIKVKNIERKLNIWNESIIIFLYTFCAISPYGYKIYGCFILSFCFSILSP